MNRNKIQQKVLLDIFASPPVLATGVIGLTILLIAWALNLSFLFTFIGIILILIAGGVFFTRLIFGIESITEEAHEYMIQKNKESLEKELDDLDAELVKNKDYRDQIALRNLRAMYSDYKEKVKEGAIPNSPEVTDKLEDLFSACISQLKRANELWDSSKSLTGSAKNKLLDERDKAIGEVAISVECFGKVIEEFHTLHMAQSNTSLAQLRNELDDTLKIAKQSEERIANFEKSDKIYDESEFQQ